MEDLDSMKKEKEFLVSQIGISLRYKKSEKRSPEDHGWPSAESQFCLALLTFAQNGGAREEMLAGWPNQAEANLQEIMERVLEAGITELGWSRDRDEAGPTQKGFLEGGVGKDARLGISLVADAFVESLGDAPDEGSLTQGARTAVDGLMGLLDRVAREEGFAGWSIRALKRGVLADPYPEDAVDEEDIPAALEMGRAMSERERLLSAGGEAPRPKGKSKPSL